MSKAELRARILATANPKPFPLDIEEWGDVYVKPLLVGELEGIGEGVDPKLRTARGVARVLCDKHGELIFDPNSTQDLFLINGLRSDLYQQRVKMYMQLAEADLIYPVTRSLGMMGGGMGMMGACPMTGSGSFGPGMMGGGGMMFPESGFMDE